MTWEEQKAAVKQMVEGYAAVERLRHEALKALSDCQAARDTDTVLMEADHWHSFYPDYERNEGMVEQQAWFAKWKNHTLPAK
jgi:Ser/Thr protein kinase RdoA (MazF antagonist)